MTEMWKSNIKMLTVRWVHKTAKIDNRLCHVCPSAWDDTVPTGMSLMQSDISSFFKNMSRKYKSLWNLTRFTGTLYNEARAFIIVSCLIIPRTRNVLDRTCTENQNTHFMLNNLFSEKGAVYEIVGNCGIQDTSDNIAHALFMLMTKTTLHLEYVILIALPRQQWYHECASTLCLYIHGVSCCILRHTSCNLTYTHSVVFQFMDNVVYNSEGQPQSSG